MKPISLHVEEKSYRELKSLAERTGRPVAELIREAPEHRLAAARRTALLRRWALLAGSRLAILEPMLTAFTLAALNLAIRLPRLRKPLAWSALIGMLEGMMRDRYLAAQLGFPADFQLHQLQEMLGLVLASFTAPT